MTDTMKERIARAILKRRFYDCEPDMYGRDLERFFAEHEDGLMVEAQDEADAVLDAMREPTERMIEGGVTADHGGTLGSRTIKCWQAMIDAAISEGKE